MKIDEFKEVIKQQFFGVKVGSFNRSGIVEEASKYFGNDITFRLEKGRVLVPYYIMRLNGSFLKSISLEHLLKFKIKRKQQEEEYTRWSWKETRTILVLNDIEVVNNTKCETIEEILDLIEKKVNEARKKEVEKVKDFDARLKEQFSGSIQDFVRLYHEFRRLPYEGKKEVYGDDV